VFVQTLLKRGKVLNFNYFAKGGLKMMKRIIIAIAVFFLAGSPSFVQASSIKEIESASELGDVIKSGSPVVADFFATWCPPCKMLAPILEELAGDYKGKVTFVKIDVDKQNELASQYQISGIPDVRIFKDGKQQKKLVGLRSKKDYQDILNSLL
jgi:thioredoxin 1